VLSLGYNPGRESSLQREPNTIDGRTLWSASAAVQAAGFPSNQSGQPAFSQFGAFAIFAPYQHHNMNHPSIQQALNSRNRSGHGGNADLSKSSAQNPFLQGWQLMNASPMPMQMPGTYIQTPVPYKSYGDKVSSPGGPMAKAQQHDRLFDPTAVSDGSNTHQYILTPSHHTSTSAPGTQANRFHSTIPTLAVTRSDANSLPTTSNRTVRHASRKRPSILRT